MKRHMRCIRHSRFFGHRPAGPRSTAAQRGCEEDRAAQANVSGTARGISFPRYGKNGFEKPSIRLLFKAADPSRIAGDKTYLLRGKTARYGRLKGASLECLRARS